MKKSGAQFDVVSIIVLAVGLVMMVVFVVLGNKMMPVGGGSAPAASTAPAASAPAAPGGLAMPGMPSPPGAGAPAATAPTPSSSGSDEDEAPSMKKRGAVGDE